MIKLGLDFDNTLINYDPLFKKVAIEKELIPEDFPESKKLIKDFLIKKDKEELFTLLQGEVYGSRISEACQSLGMFSALKLARESGINLYIVSHKTKTPYAGPKYNLHIAAMDWLKKNLFFEESGIKFKKENVFFEISKKQKLERIHSIGCSHFIDDLPEILDMINPKITRIFYNPHETNINNNKFLIMKNWKELNDLIKI